MASPFSSTFGVAGFGSGDSFGATGLSTPKPQKQGFSAAPQGAFAPAQPNPYTTGPGLQPGQNMPQMQGFDFSKPGAAEQQWTDQGWVYEQPSFGEVNTQGIVQNFSNPANRPDVTNNQQGWFDRFSSSMPSIASDPGLAPYFENAKNRAAESINKSAAATGSYGASSANDQISRAFTDLEGQRALKEADYNLSRLGEQRAWEGLGGQLGAGADAASVAASQDEQGWADLLSKLGIDSSRLGLDRLNSSFDASNVAQGAQTARGQNAIANEAAAADRLVDLFKFFMGPALANEWDAMEAASSGGVAEGNAAVANENANANTTADAVTTGLSLHDRYSQ